jgi:predicted transcriptional regulator
MAEGKYSTEAQLGILHTKADVSAREITELRSILRQLEIALGSVKIIEIQTLQTVKDHDRLSITVHNLNQKLADIQEDLEKDVSDKIKDIESKIQVAGRSHLALEKWIRERYNIGRGIFLVVNAIVFLLGGISTLYVKSVFDKMQDIKVSIEGKK